VAFSFRDSYPSIYLLGVASVSRLEVYDLDTGALFAPTSGAVDIYGPGGALVASPVVTIVGLVPQATVAAIATLGEGYRERWVLVIDGDSYVKYRDAAVARSPLQIPLSDADLALSFPDMSRNLGTVATSFGTFIQDAWGRIMRRLRSGGVLPYIVIQTSALYDCHRELTMHLVYSWWYGAHGGERFKELADEARMAYEREWAAVSYEVDRDQDGTSDGADRETPSKASIVIPGVAPSSYRNSRRVW